MTGSTHSRIVTDIYVVMLFYGACLLPCLGPRTAARRCVSRPIIPQFERTTGVMAWMTVTCKENTVSARPPHPHTQSNTQTHSVAIIIVCLFIDCVIVALFSQLVRLTEFLCITSSEKPPAQLFRPPAAAAAAHHLDSVRALQPAGQLQAWLVRGAPSHPRDRAAAGEEDVRATARPGPVEKLRLQRPH